MFRNYDNEYKKIINKYAIDEKMKTLYLKQGENNPTIENYGYLLRTLAFPVFSLFENDKEKAMELATLAGNFDLTQSAAAFAEMASSLILNKDFSRQELEEAQQLIEKASKLDPSSQPGEMVFDTAKAIQEATSKFNASPKP